ncbi:hypothetical protein [Pediococcus pentosaceus]|jgi:hypothetical protein|uniref:hypothetical protein n=1 Tax=Pediococcus pentosaceus TaxID=1255 RepID=UPI0013638247|nr:hypothetical protein [Pediococcus pentosaceus]QHM64389.1 hypothetical protein C7M48_00092 [Pediococcus pentosaceus]QHM66107.1 hypothetical protein C7M49_00004 [Pediococcus pentosaceus]QHM67992.1 hypothetical protein C7M50_00054 [Pediococcus pentosaceus]
MIKCKYCNFDETGSYFPTKEFKSNHYESGEVIRAIGGGLQLDYDNKPTLGVWAVTSEIGHQYGWNIKYCPMCGRKLEVEDE